MCEEESNSCSQTDFDKHLSEITLAEEICSSLREHELEVSNRLQSSQASSHTCILASRAEVTALTNCCGMEERCSCISEIYLRGTNVDMSTTLTSRHQFCGWEHRMLPSASSSHIIIAQNSNQCLESTGREASKSATSLSKSKVSLNNQSIGYRRTDFSKSQIHSYYVHSDKTFLYEFEHHVESGSSFDIDKYRKTITYPKMEQKSMLGDGPADMTLWSGRCVQSSSTIKPKLFVLGKTPATVYTKPLTYVKRKHTHGQWLYSTPDSRVNPTNFRLSNMTTTLHLHHHYHHPHHSQTYSQPFQLQMPTRKVEYSSRDEPRPYPLSVVGSFSTQKLDQSPNHSPAEDNFAGAEEDSDNQLSMTWISQPAPESFLIGTVTYSNVSQRVLKHRNSSMSFKGAANVNSARSTNRGASSTLLTIASERPSSGHNGVERLNHSFPLSTQNNIIMPLTKPEKAQTRTDKLGHLLTRRQKTNEWRTHTNDTISLVSAHGIY